MLDVRRMRVLREVALRGSIAAAAEALSFTPSAVSQQVAKLEREAGVPLVHRGPRSIRLTEAGHALVAHTEAILERLAEAEAELRGLAGQEPVLRVGSITTAAVSLIPEALARFARLRPETEVTVLEADTLLSLVRLKSGELDLAVVFEYDYVPLPADERLEREVLVEEEMRAVLPAGHPAARPRRRDVDQEHAALLLSSFHRARLPGGGLRAAHRLRVRRLHGDAEPRRVGRRGGDGARHGLDEA
jgi:DNA-binding transcriptional LysR family regulator